MNDQLKKSQSDRAYMVFAIRIMGEFTYIIALPVVILVLSGNWLDHRYHTRPLFLLLGFVIAAMISGLVLYRRSKELGKEYQDLEKKKS